MLIVGWGGGITGPTTPAFRGPTVGDTVARNRYEEEHDRWLKGGQQGAPPDVPERSFQLLTRGTETIAIIPTNGRFDGQEMAERLAALYNVCQGYSVEQIQNALQPTKEGTKDHV